MNKKKFFLTLVVFMITCFSIGFHKNSIDAQDNNPEKTTDKKIVYLTFDDGPCSTTNVKVLDVLKKYNVKATFFLVGGQIDGNEDVVRRIHKEGHSIGSHSYTHNYKKIYSNDDVFIKEMVDTKEKLKDVLGFYPTLLRFPGGSYKHLSHSMLEKLHKNQFKVFDWNVDTKDGMYPNLAPSKILANAKKCIKDCDSLIVLMHCNSANGNTAKALPSIIGYYKNEGFDFKPITDDTKEYYYNIRK